MFRIAYIIQELREALLRLVWIMLVSMERDGVVRETYM